MDFVGRDVVSIKDFSKEEIEYVLATSEKMLPVAEGKNKSSILNGKVLASLFYESSTRTRLSFESAILRLGGSTIGFAEPQGSSFSKGETIADTVRMAASYADVILIRHPNEGAAKLASQFSTKPVINAGDGAGQHPTQTLLDLFTIKNEKGRIDDLNIVLVGDLKYGRTVHSLSYALSLFGANLTFVAPNMIQMPPEVMNHLKDVGKEPALSDSLPENIQDADVLYVTRIQKERFPDEEEYRKVAGLYRIDNTLLKNAKNDLIIMHPLPRVDEISSEVDATPHAIYFKQAFNGVIVRMALLGLLLIKDFDGGGI
ncbi:MAG: aspartate carbamoyltransferase [Thermoplasmata archaeon]|nr:MAG: aspartate carbamoyltransferase [Thermoplasmata archaeon]